MKRGLNIMCCSLVTDIFDVHNYEQDPQKFVALFEPMKTVGGVYVHFPERQIYEDQHILSVNMVVFGGNLVMKKAGDMV